MRHLSISVKRWIAGADGLPWWSVTQPFTSHHSVVCAPQRTFISIRADSSQDWVTTVCVWVGLYMEQLTAIQYVYFSVSRACDRAPLPVVLSQTQWSPGRQEVAQRRADEWQSGGVTCKSLFLSLYLYVDRITAKNIVVIRVRSGFYLCSAPPCRKTHTFVQYTHTFNDHPV